MEVRAPETGIGNTYPTFLQKLGEAIQCLRDLKQRSPKYAVSKVVGDIQGKSVIRIARQFGARTRNFAGEVFWAGGYFASTVGEEVVRAYI